MKIAIVEDDEQDRERLAGHIVRFFSDKETEHSEDLYTSPSEFLEHGTEEYQIVFLDIELPKMNGIELAHEFRKYNTAAILIFVTNYSAFAVDGYAVNALDYILKPVSYEDFVLTFERALQRLNSVPSYKQIVLRYGDSVERVSTAEIYYVEVIKHKLLYHTTKGDFEVRGVLKKAEEELEGEEFARCNNYCLVGLRYVQSVKGYALGVNVGTDTPVEILISHPRKKDFMIELNRYFSTRI